MKLGLGRGEHLALVNNAVDLDLRSSKRSLAEHLADLRGTGFTPRRQNPGIPPRKMGNLSKANPNVNVSRGSTRAHIRTHTCVHANYTSPASKQITIRFLPQSVDFILIV